MYIGQEDNTSSCASGGIDLHGRHLIEGRLFVVVKELWEDISGFEVWEIKVKEADVKEGVLSEEVMLSKVIYSCIKILSAQNFYCKVISGNYLDRTICDIIY